DVLPTLCELVGQPIPVGTQGVSLLPALFGGPALPRRPILMTDAQQYAVILWPWKLLVRPLENLTELYDLSVDFGEHHDLSAAWPQRVHELNYLYASIPEFRLDQSPEARRLREERARAQLTP